MITLDYRCSTCKKLLFKGILVDSAVEVKCRGCGAMNVFKGITKERMICMKPECAGRVTVDSAIG